MIRSFPLSVAAAIGLLLLYVGERLVGAGTARWVLSGLGAVLILVALALRFLRFQRATGESRSAEAILLALTGGVALGMVLYAVQSDLVGMDAGKLRSSLGALWPAVLVTALLPLLLVEMSYAAMARAPVIEAGRLREALFSGLGMAFAIVFAFTAVYVFTKRDEKWDLSYFRTARPGTAAQNLVASLEEPIDVYLFFPPANDVREELRSYFDVLAKASPNLRVHDLDQAVDLAKAKELGVTGNGSVVFARGGRREQMQFGQRLEQARTQLRNLDKDAQKHLLKLAKSKRVVYLTSGHGERSESKAGPNDQRSTITVLRELLVTQNYELRNLGPAEGLAADVPEDAAAVVMVGPTSEPMPEEIASLSRYFKEGGRLFVALDPDSNVSLGGLFAPLGILFNKVPLANDQVFIAKRHIPADRAWLLLGSYSSHPSVTTLSQNGARMPMGMLVAGSLETTKDKPREISVDFTVHAHAATWNDADGNFNFDPGGGEVRKSYEVAAAVTRKTSAKAEEQGRMVLVTDSDALSDAVIQNPGNAYFLVDGMRWLFGEESLAGETNSEVDVPVQHTRRQNVAWFYSTVFLVPAAILGIGFWATRRGRKAARKTEAAR